MCTNEHKQGQSRHISTCSYTNVYKQVQSSAYINKYIKMSFKKYNSCVICIHIPTSIHKYMQVTTF